MGSLFYANPGCLAQNHMDSACAPKLQISNPIHHQIWIVAFFSYIPWLSCRDFILTWVKCVVAISYNRSSKCYKASLHSMVNKTMSARVDSHLNLSGKCHLKCDIKHLRHGKKNVDGQSHLNVFWNAIRLAYMPRSSSEGFPFSGDMTYHQT